MADLRDKLLKAGLIDRKAKQAADADARREKKKRKGKAGRRSEDALRRAEWEEAQRQQAEENRAREASRQLAQEARERANRIANLAGAWAVRESKPGTTRWCFVTRARKILWLWVGPETARGLRSGALAIVERPGDVDEPYAAVPRYVAERIQPLDPEAIRFWNRDGAPPDHGAPGASP